MIEKITVPDIGENVVSGSVVAVLVSPGDPVEKDDGIIEFETEKAVVEIPSPAKGNIVEIRVKVGDELKIGDVIATLETESGTPEAGPGPAADPTGKEREIMAEPGPARLPEGAPAEADGEKTGIREKGLSAPAAPSVRRLARELGADIHAVKGSGPGGRISEKDLKHYIQTTRTNDLKPRADSAGVAGADPDLPDFTRWGMVETQTITSIRRITAENMARSWKTVPQVTQFDRADISRMESWIKAANQKAAASGGKLTLTAVLVKVIAEGLKRFPRFNASLDMRKQQLILKRYIHVGMAVDTERGLLVPVIRDADRKSITDIANEIADLAHRARRKRLQPDEMEGGTFTLSNQGGIGGTYFTPIVFWPQAAILGMGRTTVEALYVDEKWVPGRMLPLALSYDHRINDGADAARFLRWICDALEHPLTMYL